MGESLLFINDDGDIPKANDTYFTADGFKTCTAVSTEEVLRLLEDGIYQSHSIMC